MIGRPVVHVDSRGVEGQRAESTFIAGLHGHTEVPVAGLVEGARKGNVEVGLDVPVVRTEDLLGYGGHPWVGDQLDETADALRMDRKVVPVPVPGSPSRPAGTSPPRRAP